MQGVFSKMGTVSLKGAGFVAKTRLKTKELKDVTKNIYFGWNANWRNRGWSLTATQPSFENCAEIAQTKTSGF